MKDRDIRFMERMLATGEKFIEQMAEARRRDLIGDWNGTNRHQTLKQDVAEFVDWQQRRVDNAKAERSQP